MFKNFLRNWSPKVETPAEYRQAGALPYALIDGRLSVLLITSRRNGRWIFPKGAIELNMSPSEAAGALGTAMMAAAITSLTGQILVVQWLRAPALVLLALAVPAIGLGAGVLWLFDSRLGMTLAVMLVGMGIGFGMPAIMSLASLRVDSSEQGRVAGLASACPSLGFVLGPLVGTGLYTLDHRFPYMLVVMLMVPLAVLVWRLRRAGTA